MTLLFKYLNLKLTETSIVNVFYFSIDVLGYFLSCYIYVEVYVYHFIFLGCSMKSRTDKLLCQAKRTDIIKFVTVGRKTSTWLKCHEFETHMIVTFSLPVKNLSVSENISSYLSLIIFGFRQS